MPGNPLGEPSRPIYRHRLEKIQLLEPLLRVEPTDDHAPLDVPVEPFVLGLEPGHLLVVVVPPVHYLFGGITGGNLDARLERVRRGGEDARRPPREEDALAIADQ